MTSLANGGGVLLVEVFDIGVTFQIVTIVTVSATGRLWIRALPFCQKDMEMIAHILFLGNISMTLQTVLIRQWSILNGWLRIMPTEIGNQIRSTCHQPKESTRNARPGVAVNTF